MSTENEYIEFIQKVAQYEKNWWLADLVYLQAVKCLDDVRKDLTTLNKDHVDEIIMPFLVTWGQMARSISQVEEKDWNGLVEKLRKQKSNLDHLNKWKLLDITFDNETKEAIKSLYGAVQVKYVGPTSVSKILHLLAPEVLPIWDDQLRGKRPKGYEVKATPEGYVKYMEKMQEIAVKFFPHGADQVIQDISKHLTQGREEILEAKTVAKLIDEFVWTKCHEKG